LALKAAHPALQLLEKKMNKKIPTKNSIPTGAWLFGLIIAGSVAGYAVMAWA